jgi:hypothetical protein
MWFYTVSHTTTYTLVLLNKFSLITPCHILLVYMFQAQWLIIRNKLSLKLQLASQYHLWYIIYCNKFAGSISQWKFITLKAQYTTVDYN